MGKTIKPESSAFFKKLAFDSIKVMGAYRG
jgi:hypothetical protein